MHRKRYMETSILLLAVIAVQLATQMTGTGYFLTQLTMSAYYSLVIIGLCLLMGYAGQISLGHAGFFAMGGYVSAVLTTFDLSPYKETVPIKLLNAVGILVECTGLYGESLLNFHPWPAFLSAMLLTAAIAYIVGGPVLKLKGHYLAMATLGVGTIVYRIVIGARIFGEADGIAYVPAFAILPGLEVSGKSAVRVENYYIAWGLVIICMTALLNLMDSRVGRALKAIHGSEDAANSIGVNTSRYKLNTFVLSAVIASAAGVFLTHYNGGIGPSEASIMKSIRYVAIVAVGGMSNLWGALIMGAALNFLSLRGYFGTLDDAVFGAILIVMMLFAPEGIMRANVIAFFKNTFGFGGAKQTR